MKMYQRFALKVSVIVFGAAFTVVSAFLGVRSWAGRDMPFDSDLWKRKTHALATGSGVESPRRRMINDLLDRHLHRGMGKDDVLQLLGDPRPGEDVSWESEWHYWLADYFGWDIDPVCAERLSLSFSAKGRLEGMSTSTCWQLWTIGRASGGVRLGE